MPSSGLNAGDSESCKVMTGSLPSRSSQWSRSCWCSKQRALPTLSAKAPGTGCGGAWEGGGSQPLPQAWQPSEEQSKDQCDPSASCTQPF